MNLAFNKQSSFKEKIKEALSVDLRSLALFRICLGLLVIADLIYRSLSLEAHYSDEGAHPRGVLLYHMNNGWTFSLHLINGTTLFQGILFLIEIFFAFQLVIGYRTWFATLMTWIFTISLHNRNAVILNGGDTLMGNILFFSMFIPLGASFSIDSLQNSSQNKKPSNQLLTLGTLGILLQVAFMYIFTAILKMRTDVWQSGKAIYNSLSLCQCVTPFGEYLLQFKQVLEFLTPVVLYFELIGPFLMFMPILNGQIRLILMILFFILQVGFGATLTICLFPWASVVAILPFLPSYFWDSVLKKVRAEERWTHFISLFQKQTFSNPLLEKILLFHPNITINTLKPSAFTNVIVSFFLLLIFWWNLSALNPKYTLPIYLSTIENTFRLIQNWAMFAPPGTRVVWIVIPGELKNGKTVDILQNGKDVKWEKPKSPTLHYRNQRWMSLLATSILPGRASSLVPPITVYLCKDWNKKHTGENQVTELKFYVVYQKMLDSYELADPEKISIWKQICLAKE